MVQIFTNHLLFWPILVAARYEFYGRSPAEILDSSPVGDIDFCSECCVLSGRGLCVRLITRLEEFYRK